jgi:hypothetical protein
MTYKLKNLEANRVRGVSFLAFSNAQNDAIFYNIYKYLLGLGLNHFLIFFTSLTFSPLAHDSQPPPLVSLPLSNVF